MSLLYKIKNVSYAYNDKFPAIENFSLNIPTGEVWSFLGANGSGKSTLLDLLAGLKTVTEGEIFFHDHVMENTKASQSFLRSKIGVVFQNVDAQLFCATVRDEILFGLNQIGLTQKECDSRLEEVLALLQLENLVERAPFLLSGGEKKRVALASILAVNPEVLILDEIFSGLDPRNQSLVSDILWELHACGKSILFSTHDLNLVQELNTNTVVLGENHQLLSVGKSEEILKDTNLLIKANLMHFHLDVAG